MEQRKGSGSPWKRRSRTSVGSVVQNVSEAYNGPIIAVTNTNFLVSMTLGYMRYREPQALRIEGSVISIDVISEKQLIGEGKGLWNVGMITIQKLDSNSDTKTSIQNVRWQSILECERGLLIHCSSKYYSDSGVLPPLGYGSSPITPIKSSYISTITKLHEDTINKQWKRAKTYGSQIWPDVQFDSYFQNSNPSQCDGRHGYWNPHAHELVEFFRSGDPMWVHDFALPLANLMTYTAYLNVGKETHDFWRNGLCINSGGDGDGQWHRSGFGSDDYMYNLAVKFAYPLRPDPIHRRRIEMTGRTVRVRYDRSVPENQRDIYLEKLDVARVSVTFAGFHTIIHK